MTKSILNSKLICIPSGSTMAEAKELMQERRIRHLPVVSAENNIIAMLSQHDLTDVSKFADLPVDLFASSPVQYVTSDTPMSVVAYKMIENKISSLILCDAGEKAVGIITSTDLLMEYAKIMKAEESETEAEVSAPVDFLRTAGEFARRLSDIGI